MRLETGVFIPDGDWPGVFIRGDNALTRFLPSVNKAIDIIGKNNGSYEYALTAVGLVELARVLSSCNAQNLPQGGDALTISGTQPK